MRTKTEVKENKISEPFRKIEDGMKHGNKKADFVFTEASQKRSRISPQSSKTKNENP